MLALNNTQGLWARSDSSVPNGVGHSIKETVPICCWNVCASIHPAKAPRSVSNDSGISGAEPLSTNAGGQH